MNELLTTVEFGYFLMGIGVAWIISLILRKEDKP